tara:strand:- start:270 stop:1409 length:1140 start_codon:yes stop_codon:yes gene_type:complete
LGYIGRQPTGSILTGADIADGSISTDKLADTAVSTAKLANNAVTSAKILDSSRLVSPIIINGDMSIAQRATSSTGQTGSGYKTVDRIRLSPGGGMTFTVAQASESPTGQGFTKSYKVTSTTGDASMTAAEYNIPLQMRMEGNTLQSIKKGTSNAEKTTFAFWVYATVTGTYVLELTDDDNNRYVSQTYTISSSNTWEKKIVNFPADTTGAFNNDNNKSMTINFWGGAGTNFTSGSLQTTWGAEDNTTRASGQVNAFASNNNVWQITGLQYEIGEFSSTTIPTFPFTSADDNLKRCCRYFQDYASYKLWTTALDGNTTTRLGGTFAFNTTMRATPSVSKTNNTGTIDSQTITDKGYSVFAEKSNRGTTTNVTDIELDSEL